MRWSEQEGLVTCARLMRGFGGPWGIAGGWALDLFLGRQTREHADVDVALFREDQMRLRDHLRGWSFRKAVAGELVEWHADEWLALPVHEIHASPGLESQTGMEFLLNEQDGEDWVFRRDAAVRLPARHLFHQPAEGLAYLNPAVVLLYKAKQPRATDEADFASVAPSLTPMDRAWLRSALGRVHPGHPWLAGL